MATGSMEASATLKNRVFALGVLLLISLSFAGKAQTYYSRNGGGNWGTNGTWSTTSHAGNSCNCTPTAGSTVLIGDNDNVVFVSGAPAAISIGNLTIDDDGDGGSLTFGNGGTATTLTITGNLTVNGEGTLQSGNTGATLHTIRVGGNLVNDGTFNFNAGTATNQVMVFNGALGRTVSGAGSTFTFRNLTLQTTLLSNLNVNTDISINGTLDFAASGLLVVGSSANVSLGATATITATSGSLGPARHVQLDGGAGDDSQLIRLNNGTTAAWQLLFPVGTSTGGYTPVDLSAATISSAPVNNSTLAIKPIYNANAIGQLRRTFRMTVAGNTNATTFTGGVFSFSPGNDVSASDALSDYNAIWYLDISAGDWSSVSGTIGANSFTGPGTGQMLSTGSYFYTIAKSMAYKTWYTYQSGTWTNVDNWTQDPTGTTLVNPKPAYPGPGDVIVILNGYTITANVDNVILSATRIEGGGTLDMAARTGNDLGNVTGSGLLRVNGVNLPGGSYTSFVAAGTGGTIEYYNTGGTLGTTQTTYNNLLFSNNTASAVNYITTSNLTINGNLTVSQTSGTGSVTWQINDATAAQQSITLYGNLTVSAGGRIRVGTGNEGTNTAGTNGPTFPHDLFLYGDLTNNGSIKFFDANDTELEDADYTSRAVFTEELQGNAVNVNFVGVKDNTVACNGQTDFYRLILNKGTGQQPLLTVNSTNTNNFRLFGPANLNFAGASPTVASVSDNALSIQNGTLKLTGSISIPTLVESGLNSNYGWPIPQTGALWLDGAGVTVQVTHPTTVSDNGRPLLLFGLLKVSGGTMNLGYSRGLLGGGSGVFLMESGTLNTYQLRTIQLTSGNNFAYIQSGGTVNIGTAGITGVDITTYPRFALPFSTCTFRMSGGTLNVGNPINGGNANENGIMINASTSNIEVSGGTVNATIPASGVDFIIVSNAPFFNFGVNKAGAGTAIAMLANGGYYDPTTGNTVTVTAKPLVVLNNLTLTTGNTPTLNANGNNITVGGNIDIQTNTVLTPGANTITLNGGGAQSWTNNGTLSNLNNVVMNKSAGTLTLGGSNGFPNTGNITGLTLTSGTLADGGKTLTVTTTLSNSAVHTGTGMIVATGVATIGGNDGVFSNLNVTANATITVTGDQTISGNLRLVNGNSTLNILSNRLTVSGNLYSDAATSVTGFSSTKRILTNGLRNDKGLTRQAVSGADLLFPVGTSTAAYSPITINATATTAGAITVRPVRTEHPNVTATSRSLQYYWRVTSTGFSGVTVVNHKTYSFGSTGLLTGTLTAYRPARYDPSSFSWSYGPSYNAGGTTTIPNFNQATGWTPSGGILIDGEYTAGETAAFGPVTVFYSRQSGNWNVNTTWSYAPCSGTGTCGSAVGAGVLPAANNPVVIGDNANNHVVTIDANGRSCGSLFIAAGSILDCGTRTSLDFGINTTGTGTLRIASATATAVFPNGDFTNFLATGGGTVEWYGATTRIPTVGLAPENISLAAYNNLVVSPNAGATITLPNINLTTYNDLTIGGLGQTYTDETAAHTITVNGNFNVSSGVLSIRNGFATNLILNKDMTISAGATVSMESGATMTHTLTTYGTIRNYGTAAFRSSNEVMNVVFTGVSDASFTGTNGGAITTLNFLTINKGTSQTPVVTFDVAGAVTCLTNNWLTLQNGTLNFNKPGQTFVTTDVVDVNYTIPSTARLKVQSGTVIIGYSTDDNDNADLMLSGTLEVAGGAVRIGRSDEDNDSDIEYASAGIPAITVSSGSLYVNGQVRRSTSTLAGALAYKQTGGTVTIGGRSADNTRGVFEIENYTGSDFTLGAGASLTIERPTGGTQYADLYLNPASSAISPTSVITIGSSTLGVQALDIDIVPAVGNLTVPGVNNNEQTVDLKSNALRVAGTLTIGAESTLNTNAFDVTIGGHLTIDPLGVYNGSANTTIFNGSGLQTGSLSSGSSFRNITVNKPVGTLTLSGTSPTITNLNHLSGTLDVTTIGLAVNGDIVINSAQIGTGSITLSGNNATHTITSGGGSFTNLAFSNSGAAYKNVTVEGNLTINGQLSFGTDNRYLSIGEYQLTFGPAASVTGAKSTAYIRTNGIAGDLGVVRSWPLGSSSFTYEVGAGNNYTPVTFTLNVSGAGTLNVVPVNQAHPTHNIGSLQYILNYYWIVSRSSSLAYSATGSHVYKYQTVPMGGSGGALVAGLLDISNPEGWITAFTDHGGTANANTMTFSNRLDDNLPEAGNTFHYSVGTVQTLPNPIVPVYSRFADANGVSNPTTVGNAVVGGSWNDANSWTTSPTGYGSPLQDAPTGVPVVILPNARINMNVNARTAFMTKINGLLVLAKSFAHNLGILSGTGTMRTETNTFPAGNYTAYVSASGGTIEYVAPMIMNSRSVYNNLSVYSGTPGTVTMTNTDLVLNGNMTIPTGTTVDNSVNNRNISIAGNWQNSGTFTTGTGTVTFNGAVARDIAGVTTYDQNISGTTTFNKLAISKSSGNVVLSGTGSTTVNTTLTLSSGKIAASTTHILSLASSAATSGGSATSFVAGPLRKTMAAGSFTFPVGSIAPTGSTAPDRYRPAQLSNTSATETWTVEYVGKDPTADSYPDEVMNTTNIRTVSNFEYWLISRAGSASADVTLSYNTGSYRPDVGNIGDVANLRVARWDGAQWDVPPGGGTFSQTGTDITGTVTVTNVINFSPFTLASLDLGSPLPVVWLTFKAVRKTRGVMLNWKVAQEHDNERFDVERSFDGLHFSRIGSVASLGDTFAERSYDFMDAEASSYSKYYYRIKQVDLDGQYDNSAVVFLSATTEAPQHWTVYPNPVNAGQQFHLKSLSPSVVDEQIYVTLTSVNGIVLYQNYGTLETVSAAVETLLHNAGAGLYIISVSDGERRENFKVIRR